MTFKIPTAIFIRASVDDPHPSRDSSLSMIVAAPACPHLLRLVSAVATATIGSMTIKLLDKVRSLGGVEGEVVQIDADLRAAMVRVPGKWRGTDTVSIPVSRLKTIDEFSHHFEGPFG